MASQLCCTLVGHLMVDMWMRADPTTATQLACSLLRRCGAGLACPWECAPCLTIALVFQVPELYRVPTCRLIDSDKPAVQLHAIDLLYNLSVHSNMLLSEGRADTLTASKCEVGGFEMCRMNRILQLSVKHSGKLQQICTSSA